MAQLPKIILKWEYRQELTAGLTEDFLSYLGDEGWELSGIYNPHSGGSIAYFKRPKLDTISESNND